ncbi:MAG: hypothetical protein RL757_2473, partial [Bacteroidota bacterium]
MQGKIGIIFAFLLFLIPPPSIQAQNAPDSVRKDSFPLAWVGNWAGTLEITNAKGIAQRVPMELIIEKTDSSQRFRWAIVYGEDKKTGLRDYYLDIIDPKKGLYIVDEGNGIRLESYLLGNKLMASYVVEGNAMTVTEEKNGDQIVFEIVFWKDKPVSETGGKKV